MQNLDLYLDNRDDLYSNLDDRAAISLEDIGDIIGNTESSSSVGSDISYEEDDCILNSNELSNLLDKTELDEYNADQGEDSHLRLAEANNYGETEFKTYIPSKLNYPCIVVKRDTFVEPQFRNLFSLIEKGNVPLAIECKGDVEEIYRIKMSAENIIDLRRIFGNQVYYRRSQTEEKIIEPIDLLSAVVLEEGED